MLDRLPAETLSRAFAHAVGLTRHVQHASLDRCHDVRAHGATSSQAALSRQLGSALGVHISTSVDDSPLRRLLILLRVRGYPVPSREAAT